MLRLKRQMLYLKHHNFHKKMFVGTLEGQVICVLERREVPTSKG